MKTVKKFILAFSVLLSITAFSAPVLAGTVPQNSTNPSGSANNNAASTAPTQTNDTVCDQNDLTADQQTSCQHCATTSPNLNDCLQNNVIVKRLNDIVDFLSAGVGIVVVATIITGGIQYSMAGGSPEAVNKAKTRLMNGVIALGVFLLIFGFLQWIVPGGIFNS